MKSIIILTTILLCLNLSGAEWKKINSSTIEISGNFNVNEVQNLTNQWNDDIKSIVVKESRNNELDLSVGNFLKSKKFDLTINGLCSVNCIENLLLSATSVKIENGCFRVSEKASDLLKFRKKEIRTMDNNKLTKIEQDQFIKSIKEWKSYQDDIFKLKNIKPLFYADHDLVAKGLIYFPSTMYLVRSGFKLQGEVDLDCIRKSETKAYYYK